MIEQHYGELQLPLALHHHLEKLLSCYTIPVQATRLVINYRALDYYQTKQGIHPIEIQLKKNGDQWLVMFIASFSFTNTHHKSVDVELYFHLINHWCYQPDAGGRCNLLHPTINDLFHTWVAAFLHHIQYQRFDDISLTVLR
ncbi:TPA: DUF2787 family protein [Photobacterium damselae]|uniref:Protein of uncharacterized function (DUF2787) n=1 Tax=Photobacterium damselae TaxID=38293 RepID=A0A2T3QKF3_PHODM|nr:DUF2787 family protein [Photobacterium damselae]PSW85302.1 DUF2787 domain-containing protein [Photobacterium damselae]SPY27380.1 Protein of uncharacterised function (DUF2787) [Photobacterium damselae]